MAKYMEKDMETTISGLGVLGHYQSWTLEGRRLNKMIARVITWLRAYFHAFYVPLTLQAL